MKRYLAAALFLCSPLLLAQRPERSAPAAAPEATPTPKPGAAAKPTIAEEAPIVTHHQIHVGGKLLSYTATVGQMPLKNEVGDVEAHIFYIAYTLDQPAGSPKRPLLFSFNGGPGAASVWMHIGMIGPRRIRMGTEGFMPAPPYQVEDNDATWLPQTDIVFLDTVGTGYSRAMTPALKSKFLGVQEDIRSVGDFIRLYLTRYERWSSPLFLVGESYGTTRAAGLSGYLLQHGIALNGIMLVSSVLNFETLEFTPGNDLPYQLYLPTYTATAFYHHKLDPALDLKAALKESEAFAAGAYPDALAKGDRLTPAEFDAIATEYARLTGLSKSYVSLANLRVDEPHFTRELLRQERMSTGRIDSRFKGAEPSGITEASTYDPFVSAITPPFTAAIVQYLRTELGYKSDEPYYVLGGGFGDTRWNWGSNPRAGFPNVTGSLRDAFAQNPYMKLFIASGYFDLATPYFATQYTVAHLNLLPEEKARISTDYFESGHMMYVREKDLTRMHDDAAKFMSSAQEKPAN
jgi:carboxypeptidase C (cathepsin A)